MRVVIADDSVLLREGIARLLEDAGFEIVAKVADAPSLLKAMEQHLPDIALVDVRMPPTFSDEGLRAALVIRKQWPDVAVLVLSQYVEERYASELLASDTDGVGYLLKDRVADVNEFVDALRRVAAGGTALDSEVVTQLLARSRRVDPLGTLTARERDVMRLWPKGGPTGPSPRPWWCRSAQWRSTSPTSSSSSICPLMTRITDGFWPCSSFWSREEMTMTHKRSAAQRVAIGVAVLVTLAFIGAGAVSAASGVVVQSKDVNRTLVGTVSTVHVSVDGGITVQPGPEGQVTMAAHQVWSFHQPDDHRDAERNRRHHHRLMPRHELGDVQHIGAHHRPADAALDLTSQDSDISVLGGAGGTRPPQWSRRHRRGVGVGPLAAVQ